MPEAPSAATVAAAVAAHLRPRRADEPLRAWIEDALAHRPNRLLHTLDVAARARLLAEGAGVDPAPAERAGLLHDVARALSLDEQAAALVACDAPPDADEERLPWLLHQRLGALVAAHLAGEDDPAVLAAIACHTTLHAAPSPLDLVLFVADKLAWRKRPRAPWQEVADVALAGGASVEDVARTLLVPWDGEDEPPAALVAARAWAATG